MNKIKKLRLFLYFVIVLGFCCIKVTYAADSDYICCEKPATHVVKGTCCNGPNDNKGNFSEECCTAKGTVHTKSDGSKYCCKNKNPQQS